MSEYRSLLEEMAVGLYQGSSGNPAPKPKNIADLLYGQIANMLDVILKLNRLGENEATVALKQYSDPDVIRRLKLLADKVNGLPNQVPIGELLAATVEVGKEFNLTRGNIVLSISHEIVAGDCQRLFRPLEGHKTTVGAIIPIDKSILASLMAAMGGCPCKDCSSKSTKPAYDEIQPHDLN